MSTLAQTTLLTPVVRRLPHRLLALLDAWSHRMALQRARQRAEAAQQRAKAQAAQRRA
jgi:hypothetical protein